MNSHRTGPVVRTQEALSQMWWAKLAWALSIASLPPRLVAALAGAALVMAGLPAQGQTERVLYSFDYVDGAHPTDSLVFDGQGNLYGTTDQSASDFGKVFELTPSGAYTVLYSFTGGWKGASPTAGLVRDIDGNLYGTTFQGGHQQCKPYGCGTVFKLHPTGKVGWLHHFNATDGWGPAGGLIRDAKGNLYGTTVYGGTFGSGTVFKVTPARSLLVLHSFLAARGASLDA
jgi:uncharacterized repeat protein (TIGR03803 family)